MGLCVIQSIESETLRQKHLNHPHKLVGLIRSGMLLICHTILSLCQSLDVICIARVCLVFVDFTCFWLLFHQINCWCLTNNWRWVQSIFFDVYFFFWFHRKQTGLSPRPHKWYNCSHFTNCINSNQIEPKRHYRELW